MSEKRKQYTIVDPIVKTILEAVPGGTPSAYKG